VGLQPPTPPRESGKSFFSDNRKFFFGQQQPAAENEKNNFVALSLNEKWHSLRPGDEVPEVLTFLR